MIILQTDRLTLRELEAGRDLDFVNELLNTPKFLEFIGDRGVRSREDAASFIDDRYRESYREHGYGLWRVELRDGGTPVGLCGFVKRDYLEHADIGFAYLPQHERKGYGYEAAAAALEHGRRVLGFGRVMAITSLHNEASAGLLLKLGFTELDRIEPAGEKLRLFSYTYAE
jgi:RimJ/RimL family protein N-acetyltransferase